MSYNWQKPDWPNFGYSLAEVNQVLMDFAEISGLVSGLLMGFRDETGLEAIVETLVVEAIKTSEIEGEFLNREDVRSSVRNNLELNITPDTVNDVRAWGAGELMVDVRSSYSEALTEEELFSWHRMIMAGTRKIKIGAWRHPDEPMQILSGAIGREVVHFEAPPSSCVAKEMEKFINWFNDTAPGGSKEIKKAPVRSSIAHLYFESIHPLEDGNGRIGRAIAEKALSQTIGRPVLLSISRTI